MGSNRTPASYFCYLWYERCKTIHTVQILARHKRTLAIVNQDNDLIMNIFSRFFLSSSFLCLILEPFTSTLIYSTWLSRDWFIYIDKPSILQASCRQRDRAGGQQPPAHLLRQHRGRGGREEGGGAVHHAGLHSLQQNISRVLGDSSQLEMEPGQFNCLGENISK